MFLYLYLYLYWDFVNSKIPFWPQRFGTVPIARPVMVSFLVIESHYKIIGTIVYRVAHTRSSGTNHPLPLAEKLSGGKINSKQVA